MPRRFSTRVYRSANRKRTDLPAPTGRKKTPAERMNKGEQRYADCLDTNPHVVAWWYEGMSWRIAEDTRYVPDFVVLLDDGRLECHEVKAKAGKDDFGVTEVSWAKIKVAAEHAPFPIVVVWWDGVAWKERRV